MSLKSLDKQYARNLGAKVSNGKKITSRVKGQAGVLRAKDITPYMKCKEWKQFCEAVGIKEKL